MIVEENVEEFLEHVGVKGMKWGVRRTQKVQAHLDRLDRISKGTATRNERGMVRRRTGTITKRSARRELRKGATMQIKVVKGKRKATNILAKTHGIKIKDLDFHQDD